MAETIVGIDLGTTNSAVAVVQNGQVKVLPIQNRSTMPSCVGIDPTGRLIVGQSAKNQLAARPEATVQSIKRQMGESTKVNLGDREFSPEEISSFILRTLKQEAEAQLGTKITKAVITVPAFFNEQQRKATQVAGQLAELEVVRIINEPTAAALAYGAGETPNEKMVVYDLGGGTFDVSVVVVEDGVVEVKASHGDTHLGGDDFDELLIQHAAKQFKQENGTELKLDAKTRLRLKEAMERAKCELSDAPFARVREEYVDGAHHLDIELERTQYEALIESHLEKTISCMHQALSDAQLQPGDIDKVMLVGGSTKTPLVQRLQKQRFQLEPHSEISPDLIVAMGAAIQAGILSGEQQHSVLVDITPHTYSIETLQPEMGPGAVVCSPIIRRNTPLPASRSEAYATASDYQEAVDVRVYQGEFPFPDQNTLVGEFRVTGLSRKPAGNLIVVHFALDLNGMLEVTATEKATGLAKTVTMDLRGKGGVSLEEARRNVADFLKESAGDKQAIGTGTSDDQLTPRAIAGQETGETEEEAEAEETDAGLDQAEEEDEESEEAAQKLAEAKELRKRALALLEKNISDDDKQEINATLKQISQAITERDWQTLQDKTASLSDLLFFLED